MDHSQNVLTIQTIQIAPFRTLITSLKEIVIEPNLVFDANGIRMISMDKTHTVVVHMQLDAKNFELFECKKEKIVIGINMYNFYRLINAIDNNDTLTIYIENNHFSDGVVDYLSLRFENGNIKQCKTQKLKLLEPDLDNMEYPEVRFSSVIILPSSDFQKIVRDMSCISNKIEIQSVGNELIFKSCGDYASAEIHRVESGGSLGFATRPDASKIIQGEFSLVNLQLFIKCTALSPQIELMLDNDLPMVVKYEVAKLGIVKLCLAPLPSF